MTTDRRPGARRAARRRPAVAFVAGFVMLLAFTGALLDHNRTKFGFFAVGAAIYVVVFVGSSVVLGS